MRKDQYLQNHIRWSGKIKSGRAMRKELLLTCGGHSKKKKEKKFILNLKEVVSLVSLIHE